jgi:hypothetical protein
MEAGGRRGPAAEGGTMVEVRRVGWMQVEVEQKWMAGMAVVAAVRRLVICSRRVTKALDRMGSVCQMRDSARDVYGTANYFRLS